MPTRGRKDTGKSPTTPKSGANSGNKSAGNKPAENKAKDIVNEKLPKAKAPVTPAPTTKPAKITPAPTLPTNAKVDTAKGSTAKTKAIVGQNSLIKTNINPHSKVELSLEVQSRSPVTSKPSGQRIPAGVARFLMNSTRTDDDTGLELHPNALPNENSNDEAENKIPTATSSADVSEVAPGRLTKNQAPQPHPHFDQEAPTAETGSQSGTLSLSGRLAEDQEHTARQSTQDSLSLSEILGSAESINKDVSNESGLPPEWVFEVAWEVCWQLGGIYTVLRTKAAAMLRRHENRYWLIGPYNPVTAPVEFEPEEPKGAVGEALQRMKNNGIPCYFGRWMIAGRPQVILIDYRALFRDLDKYKYLMWADHGISINSNDGEMNEVIAFGFGVTEFFRELTSLVSNQPILGHFHEWMGGVAVPRMAHLRLPVATVFTTHATLLGRYLAGDNPDFYNHLPFLNPEFEARKYQIYSRYQIEKAAAHAATVFTTVSEVTSYEAEKLLGRLPEEILPNGLNLHRFAATHEFQNLHRQYKERIHEFVAAHFFPCYTFDLDNTVYMVTSGRYEFGNKGMDLFIEALWRLNQRLKYVPNHPTVVAFIITKAPVKHVNIGALQSQTAFAELKRTCRNVQEEIGQKLFKGAARGKIPDPAELVSSDLNVRVKRAMHAWRNGVAPAIVTHDLMDDANDPVLKHLRHRHLFNAASDPVKMVFHPQFVTPTGPLIHLDYEQMVRGCHIGVFPSYYEPWGYTPMECIAMGLPTVTTDLSGFGAYVRRNMPDAQGKGICVLNRRYHSFDEACNELVEHLYTFVTMNRRQRIDQRNIVEKLSEVFDWSILVKHYHKAHREALERVGANRPGKVDLRVV